jgi:ribosomal protein L21
MEVGMYAIIEIGGKQYKVSPGQSIDVASLPGEVGETVDVQNVLLLANDGEVVVGKPTVPGATVRATVADQGRGRRITVLRFRRGNRYQRKLGHRQGYTRLLIQDIVTGGTREDRPEKAKAAAKEAVAKEAAAPAKKAVAKKAAAPARKAAAKKAAAPAKKAAVEKAAAPEKKAAAKKAAARAKKAAVEKAAAPAEKAPAKKVAAPAKKAPATPKVSVEELGLPARLVSALKDAGFGSAKDLLKADDEKLLGISGVGPKSVEQVRAALREKGFVQE